MKISYNAPAMRASNALNASDNRVSQSLGRLSSGLKVTVSKDNPSGYAIGRRMNTQITGLGTATQSSNNGISVIETADGALSEVHEMLQRMNELAVKGENGTLTTSDRMTLEAEMKQLKSEITRIASDTEFNGQVLLDGTFDLRGYTNNHKVKMDYYSDEVIPKIYTISELIIAYDKDGKIDKDPAKTKITLGPEFPQTTKVSETTETKITLTGPLDFEMVLEIPKDDAGKPVEGNLLENTVTVPTVEVKYNVDQDMANPGTYVATPDEALTNENFTKALKDTKNEDITDDARISSGVDNGDGSDTLVITNDTGFRLEITCQRPPVTAADDGKQVSKSVGGGSMTAKQDLRLDATGIGSMDIQTGANEGQQLAIRIPTISLNRMGLEDTNLKTVDDCADANKAIKGAIAYVSDARSRLGAYQNRLEHTVNNLAVSSENMTASYSRIMDVDMAEEMTNYTTELVISQSAVSMLAQANERPSQVLQLLQ